MSPDLLQRLKAGDDTAFTMFVNGQHRKLYYYVRNVIHDDVAAEDIVSDCFLKLLLHLGRLETVSHLEGWLFTAARNASITHLRQRDKWRFADSEELLHLAENDDYHDRRKTEAILMEQIYRLMKDLSARQEKILLLRYLEEKGFEEIGVLLDMKTQSVRNECSRGLAKLREKLTPEMIALFLPMYFLLYVDNHSITTHLSKNENISRKIMV